MGAFIHLEFAAYESAQLVDTDWERWAAAIEHALGHSLDGDETVDGYSMDEAFQLWGSGTTVEQYVARVRRLRPIVHRFTAWPAELEAPCIFPWSPVATAVKGYLGIRPAFARCVSCGCTDDCACPNRCWWLAVHRVRRTGVCSNCRPALFAWFRSLESGPGALLAREVCGACAMKQARDFTVPDPATPVSAALYVEGPHLADGKRPGRARDAGVVGK